MQTDNAQDSGRNQLLWLAGAVGTTVGVAVWAYSRRELSYWERTRQAAGQAVEAAAGINPWLSVGATTAVGCAALAYRLRKPKNAWQKGSERAKAIGERAQAIVSQNAKQIRPWLPVIASAGISAASAAYR